MLMLGLKDRTGSVMGGLHNTVVFIFILTQYITLVLSKPSQPIGKFCTVNSKPHRHGLCGKVITELLSTVCGKGGYVEVSEGKRSVKRSAGTIPNILDMDAKTFYDLTLKNKDAQNDKDDSLLDILYSKRDAAAFLQKKSKPFYFSGVSCDCCYHMCNLKEISSYCKDPAKAYQSLQRMGI